MRHRSTTSPPSDEYVSTSGAPAWAMNGALLDTLDAVQQFTASMTWNGIHPVVTLITTIYHTGVRLSQAAMAAIEAQIQRLPGLDKWFVDITPAARRDD